MNIILRRLKLGRTSCKEIAKHMEDTGVVKDPALVSQVGGEVDYLFRWGCTATVQNLAHGSYTVVNTAEAIHLVNNKSEFRELLVDNNPEIAPRTWFSVEGIEEGFIDAIVEGDAAEAAQVFAFDDWLLRNKVIVRPRKHAQGKQLYLCDNRAALIAACARCGEGYYISEYIPKVAEYRVFVVSGRAVWVANKIPVNPDAIAWNAALGGHFDNVPFGDWPLRAVKCAIEAFNLSQLDFGGVDVMIDADGRPYILEINSAPSQTSPYRQSCTAKAFNYIVENGKARIPLTEKKGGFRKFIHPAIHEEAILVNS